MGSIGTGYKLSSSDFDDPTQSNSGNPDPKNYEILEIHHTEDEYLIVKVKYPDSKNYEGIKILLFDKNVTVEKLWTQGKLDPHFSNNKDYYSPIARFEPTKRGMEMAKILCKNL